MIRECQFIPSFIALDVPIGLMISQCIGNYMLRQDEPLLEFTKGLPFAFTPETNRA
jgi:hypothetical protein